MTSASLCLFGQVRRAATASETPVMLDCCIRSLSAFAFNSAISRSAFAFIAATSDDDAALRSACAFASRSALALISFASCSALAFIAAISDDVALTRSACSFASRSALALISFASCSALAFIAAISAVAALMAATAGSIVTTGAETCPFPFTVSAYKLPAKSANLRKASAPSILTISPTSTGMM